MAQSFGSYLRHHREQAEMSLREMAKRLELSPSLISRVENDKAAPLGGAWFDSLHEVLPTISTLQLARLRLEYLDPIATSHLMAAIESPNHVDWNEGTNND